MLGELANVGRDKLTLVIDPPLTTLGLWIEQLIAESTGKEGKGILPVNGETLGGPKIYGNDRVFVSISTSMISETKAKLSSIAEGGHPIINVGVDDPYDLGLEFFVWEFATAVAGWRMGINPFDQPNVQEAKDATKELLNTFERRGHLDPRAEIAKDDLITIYGTEESSEQSVVEVLSAHLASDQARRLRSVPELHRGDSRDRREVSATSDRSARRDGVCGDCRIWTALSAFNRTTS